MLRCRRHALECIEQVQLSLGGARPLQRQRSGHRAAAPPDAALDERAFDRNPNDVVHGIADYEDALPRSIGVWRNLFDVRNDSASVGWGSGKN
jgi:hypothetical protein